MSSAPYMRSLITPKHNSITTIISPRQRPPTFDRDYLRNQARWIRDTLDPQIAKDGPDTLHSDDLLALDELLRRLRDAYISLDDICYSRIHLAVKLMTGLATRWPRRLIERCDAIEVEWRRDFGSLQESNILLYEPGGRLYGVCRVEDLNQEWLLGKWMREGVKVSPAVARKTGCLGFMPGDWWISPLFALYAGIIDSRSTDGGIVSDSSGAYAIVLTGSDEIPDPNPESFRYICRNEDPGRYRLTSGSPESRQAIRVLRSHTLHSFWKPRAGLRYDGLHKVTGWNIKVDTRTGQASYIVHLRRLASEISMETVLKRPRSDEVDDYSEYKRLRQMQRAKQKAGIRAGPEEQLDGALGDPQWRRDALGVVEGFDGLILLGDEIAPDEKAHPKKSIEYDAVQVAFRDIVW